MKKQTLKVFHAFCMSAALIACAASTGCFTAVTHDSTHRGKTVVQFGEFWIDDVFCDEKVSVEDLTNAQTKVKSPRIVLGGSWRLNDTKDKTLTHGYISIEASQWKHYLSYCKANHMEPTPVGALEYDGRKRKSRKKHDGYVFQEYYLAHKKPSANERRITDRFPPDGNAVTIPLSTKQEANPLEPLAIPLLLLTVPLDVATCPLQFILLIEWSLNGGIFFGT